MDKAEILRMCNDIEDEVTDIAFNSTHKHIYDCCKSIREYLKEIAEEITAPPKSNGDRIRQMTDEELAEWLDLHGECNQCAYHPAQCKTECNEGHLKWLKQEVSEDAGSKTD